MSSITIEHNVTPAKLDVLYVDDWPVWTSWGRASTRLAHQRNAILTAHKNTFDIDVHRQVPDRFLGRLAIPIIAVHNSGIVEENMQGAIFALGEVYTRWQQHSLRLLAVGQRARAVCAQRDIRCVDAPADFAEQSHPDLFQTGSSLLRPDALRNHGR